MRPIHAGLAHTSLGFLVAMGLALAGAAARAENASRPEGDDAPLPYLQPSPDDGWIEGYLRDPRRRGHTFVAGVNSDRPGCFTGPREREVFDVALSRHGVALRFDQIGTLLQKLDVVTRPDASGYLGTAEFPGCTVAFGIRKSVLRDGTWRAGRTAAPADISDWDAREARPGNAMGSSAPDALRFTFEADRDECGWGSDFAILRAHVLTVDLPDHGGLRSLRQAGSLTTNDWILGTATCRYDLSISFWTPDTDGISRPVPVSRLFADVRLPPTP